MTKYHLTHHATKLQSTDKNNDSQATISLVSFLAHNRISGYIQDPHQYRRHMLDLLLHLKRLSPLHDTPQSSAVERKKGKIIRQLTTLLQQPLDQYDPAFFDLSQTVWSKVNHLLADWADTRFVEEKDRPLWGEASKSSDAWWLDIMQILDPSYEVY